MFLDNVKAPKQFCWQSAASSSWKAATTEGSQQSTGILQTCVCRHSNSWPPASWTPPCATHLSPPTNPQPICQYPHTYIFDLAPTSVLHFCLWPQAKQAKNTENVLYFPKNQKYVADMWVCVCGEGCECVGAGGVAVTCLPLLNVL